MAQRLVRWSRLLTEFALSSGIAQAIGMVSGLIYVRYLPLGDYALYALATTTLTFVMLASDLGLNSSVTYFWRHARHQGRPFGDYLAGIRRLRLMLFVAVGVIAAMVFPAVGMRSHYGATALLVALALLLVSALLLLSAGINVQVMRLLGWFRRSYLCDVAGQSMRVIAAALMVLGVSRSYWLALLGGLMCSGITFAASAWLLRGQIAPGAGDTPVLLRDILHYVGPTAPAVLAFALQDSVILWSASRFGGADVVASVFAVGRIAAIVGLLSAFSVAVIIPRLAGIVEQARLRRVGWIVKAMMAVIGAGIVAIGMAFPAPFLSLLGAPYAHLQHELTIALATAAITLVSTPTILLNRAQGWVRLDPLVALVQMLLLSALIPLWNFTAPGAVLLLSLLLSASLLAQGLAISVLGAAHPAWVRARS